MPPDKKTIRIPVLLLTLLVMAMPGNCHRSGPDDPDRFYLVLNKPFYVSGETMWYKIYMLNRDAESRIVHIGLFNSAGKLLINQQLKVEHGAVSGSIDLPIEWPDDFYRLEILSRWNLNFGPGGIQEKIIPVYNSSFPGQLPASFNEPEDTAIRKDSFRVSGNEFRVKFNKPLYHPRDSVVMEIDPLIRSGEYNLSVDVIDLAQVPAAGKLGFNDYQEPSGKGRVQGNNDHSQFQPEKKLTLDAQVKEAADSAPLTSSVLSVFIPSSHQLLRARAFHGSLHSDLPDLYGEQVLQLLNLNPFQGKEPVVKMERIWDQVSLTILIADRPLHTTEIDEYIIRARLRRQVNEIFTGRELISSPSDTAYTRLPAADMNFDMTHFKLIANLEDFIKSVVLTVRRQKENDKTSIRLFNDQTEFLFMYHPWYLVDGLFSFEEPAILTTPFPDLRTVSFYTNKKSLNHFDPIMILYGIISITTNDSYWENNILSYPNTIRYRGFYSGKSFIDSQPELGPGNQDTPDLRPSVYWNPNLLIPRGKKGVVKFRTTDNPGLFLVELTGTDKSGSVVHQTALYRVAYP